MGIKGQKAWNKTPLDEKRFVFEYNRDKRAVAKWAKKLRVSVQALYGRLESLGVRRRSNRSAHTGLQTGSKNPNWGGGRYVGGNGYVWVRVSVGKYRMEHRVKMEKKLGRRLRRGEVVHHRNGIRTDNKLSNLQLIASQGEHLAAHNTKRAALKAVKA